MFEFLISRIYCLFLFLEAFIIQYYIMLQSDFHTNWIPNFLQELKIQTRGQYVFYKLQKTVV